MRSECLLAQLAVLEVPWLGENVKLDRLKLRGTNGQVGWVTKDAKHAGGDTYFVEVGEQVRELSRIP